MDRERAGEIVYLSRVTWLALGTTLVLVSAVVVAAVLFINGTSPSFPRGGERGASGVARVSSNRSGPAHAHRGNRVALAATRGGRQVAARPAITGLAASLGAPRTPSGTTPNPGSPPAEQYGGSLQELKAALHP